MLVLLFAAVHAQRVQTIVPKGPVVIGTAFQVQYLVTEPGELQQFTAPSFTGFRVVSGPNKYSGTASVDGKMQPILNVTFTLVPSEAGTQSVGGLKVIFRNGNEQVSPEASVLVSPPPRASFNALSNATSLPSAGPVTPAEREAFLRANLFIRATVNRKTCFVGQPVLARFQLNSSLQSTSTLDRAPGLYGFSVVDVLDINRSHQSVETIGGKVFNTYTLREVLLYPGQSGRLVVDELIVQNEIELPDSGGVHFLKRQLKTDPMYVEVLPLPEPQPADFGAAVGRFSIRAQFDRPNMAVNEQGHLLLALRGRGNFIQVSPPRIPWPSGLDVFDPQVTDSLRNDSATTSGLRLYRFAFTPADTGWIHLAPIVFSYFDPLTKSYKSDSTDPLRIYVGPKKIATGLRSRIGNTVSPVWIGIILLSIIIALATVYLLRKKKKTAEKKPVGEKPAFDAITELLALNLELPAREACVTMSRILLRARREQPLTAEQVRSLQSIHEECQLIAFTGTDASEQVEALRRRAINILDT